MRTYEEIRDAFLTAYNEQESKGRYFEAKAYNARRSAIRYQKIAARKMTEYHKFLSQSYISDVHWTNSLLLPLLKEVQERTGLDFYDYSTRRGMNTFGLRCESWTFAHNEQGKCIASLCFTPGEIGEIYIDTGERKDRFAAGTIGEINGMNNVSVKVNSVEMVIDVLKKKYPELNL